MGTRSVLHLSAWRRGVLNAVCEVILFLRSCFTYSEEYTSLYDVVAGGAAQADVMSIFRDMRALGKDVYDEARELERRHEGLYNQLQVRAGKLSSIFSNTSKLHKREGMLCASKASYLYSCAVAF